jgi:hypothetical protein
MSELPPTDHPQAEDRFHLPSPSAHPIITCLGVSLMLAGIIPSELLWRMSIMSVGAAIFVIGAALWIADAIEEYRNLPE